MAPLNMQRVSLLLLAIVLFSGCAPEVTTARMGGVFPARDANCALELRSGTYDLDLNANFDTVGSVTVRGSEGEAPNAPRVLALLKPVACELGGDTVLVNVSMSTTNGVNSSSFHGFMVLRKKAAGAPNAQKF
jgi:hypothetical protein